MARRWTPADMTGIGLIAAGFLLVAMSLGGFVIGALLDRAFGTEPVLAVIGLLLGTLIGFWDVYRIAMRLMNQQSSTSAHTLKDDRQEPEDESAATAPDEPDDNA